MRKSILKKATAVAMSLTMVVGMTGVVSAAHASNGTDVATNAKVSSFSILTEEDGGVWKKALENIRSDKYPNGQVAGKDFVTEGWLTDQNGKISTSNMEMFVKNTGWDGEYNKFTNALVGDNPWGLTMTVSDIPVELGRNYTISFKIKSTLKGTVTNEETKEEKTVDSKHILFKAYDQKSKGEPSVNFTSISGATSGGYITVKNGDDYKTVTATVKIPDKRKAYGGDVMGLKFALGAFVKTFPEEVNMKGTVYVKDLKVIAGDQYTVKFTDGSQSQAKYVNAGSQVTPASFSKKGYTLAGFKNKATGAMYNFGSAVNSDLELVAVFNKTAKPGKPSIKVKGAKKKATVRYKKVKNAAGYQIKYSAKKNMKGAKTKTTTKVKYTIKKLKSRKFTYVQVRAFAKDSTGQKVYGKFSSKKKVFIK